MPGEANIDYIVKTFDNFRVKRGELGLRDNQDLRWVTINV